MVATSFMVLMLALTYGCSAPAKGPFTQAQVNAGRQSYNSYCAGCHGDQLQGGGLQGADAPALTGGLFKQDWSKYSIAVLYRFVSKAMPQGLEGDLSAQTYCNILSYILAVNGAKPGTLPFNPASNVKIGDIADGHTVWTVIAAPTRSQTPAAH